MQNAVQSGERLMRVLCIMDLSSFGRAGLSAALPVLSACGVQACGLPSALFSTHTGGFAGVAKRDVADYGVEALAQYAHEGIAFDAVYVGYLYGNSQFALAQRALEMYPNALHVVDPAMGDDGNAYNGITAATIDRMRSLCSEADLITPNFTESAMLAGHRPSNTPVGAAEAVHRLAELATQKRAVLITSVPMLSGEHVTCGQTAGGSFTIPNKRWPQHYPGTGDLLCSAVVGLMLRHHWPLEKATRRATSFVEAAVQYTYSNAGTPREGLLFEPLLLPMLATQTTKES